MSDYLSPQGCAIGTCDGGAVWGREQVIMNCLKTFLETHIPLEFFMLILFSEAKKNHYTPQTLHFRDNFLNFRKECDVFDVRLVRCSQTKISGQARSSVIAGGSSCRRCSPVTIRLTHFAKKT